MFARSTMVCPRCTKTNDRNPLVLALKLMSFVIFIAAVTFVMRAVLNVSTAIERETVTPLPTPAPVIPDDVRF